MRRPLILLLLVVSAVLPLTASPFAAAVSADQEVPSQPNILLIVTDDQRPDTMMAMPRTSELFAAQGTTFTNAFASTPLCCPARASIFTGLYAHNHNVRTQGNAGTTLDVGLTLQRYLTDENYYTGLIGKWLNGWDMEVRPPYLNETAFFTMAGRAYTDATWNVDGKVQTVPGYSTDFMTERATGFIERAEADDDKPWFLVLTPPQPHSPFQPQRAFADASFGPWASTPDVGEEDKLDKPVWIEDKKAGRYQGRSVRLKQMRTLLSVDQMISRTFRAMAGNGEVSNTLAIFTSDNGYLWGEHGIVDVKRYPYTPSVQIPLFIRWPGRIAEGVIDERLAVNVDIAPTVLEVAGNLDRAAQLDGRSLMQPSSRRSVLLEYWNGDGREPETWAAMRTKDYQYIEYYNGSGGVIYREYYDLIEDPYQLENLLDNGNVLDDPEWVSLSRELEQMRDCSGPTCP